MNKPIVYFKQPSVRVAKSMDHRLDAWYRSRPFIDQSEDDMLLVKKLDLPVTSFLVYILEMDTSILFRDLLFTMRGIHPWATSFRQLKSTPENTLMSGEYMDHEDELVKLMEVFYKNQEDGLPQDHNKVNLPMATSAQFSVVMDHRSVVALIKTLKEVNEFLFEVYGKLILDAIGLSMDDIDDSYVQPITSSLSMSTDDYELVEMTKKSGAMTVGGMVAGAWDLKSNIMAQVIRTHRATVKNELWNKVRGKSGNELALWTCNEDIKVAMYATKEVFDRMAKVRVAWFAQWDNEDSGWSPIVGSYVKSMTPQEFWDFAGLENGNDKNVANMMGAVEGIEAHPPSPVLLENPDLVPFRMNKYKSNSVIAQKWVEVYDAGLINDNPDNMYRKIYEEAIDKNGLPE